MLIQWALLFSQMDRLVRIVFLFAYVPPLFLSFYCCSVDITSGESDTLLMENNKSKEILEGN